MIEDLAEFERVDDLLTHNLKIIQSDQVFSFSMDAVLLARFCTAPRRGRIVDLCTGNGVIPLLLSTRTTAPIECVEIQQRLADMARRSVKLNRLQERIRCIQGDLRTIHEQLGYGQFELVTVNPPYLRNHTGEKNENPYIAIARHELECTLEEVVAACSRLVRTGGKVAMVHRPNRLIDIVTLMRQYRLEPKRIRLVHPKQGAEANIVLIEAIRDGKPDVRLLPPLIVYDDNGVYCHEIQQIYYGEVTQLEG